MTEGRKGIRRINDQAINQYYIVGDIISSDDSNLQPGTLEPWNLEHWNPELIFKLGVAMLKTEC